MTDYAALCRCTPHVNTYVEYTPERPVRLRRDFEHAADCPVIVRCRIEADLYHAIVAALVELELVRIAHTEEDADAGIPSAYDLVEAIGIAVRVEAVLDLHHLWPTPTTGRT